VRPTTVLSLVPDYVTGHRTTPLAVDSTVVECDWLYAPEVVDPDRAGSGLRSTSTLIAPL
jgi:Rieske 2Fe-2S family protein